MGSWDVHYLGKRERATATKTFTFERPAELDYRPGQFFYVTLPAPKDADTEGIFHHFSFSSSPTEPDVECTTRMTGHVFKNRLDALEPGTVVRISGPDGEFMIQRDMKKVAYVVGGIGITPARSTVRWALDTDAPYDITVLYGNRDLASTAFAEEFAAIKSDKVRVVMIMSEPGPGWTGPNGQIDAGFIRERIPDWQERYIFVSGPPGMVKALSGVLADEVGVAEDHLITEDFPGYR